MMNAAASFFLSFIIFTKGEFEPSEAEFPKLAISTMENFAKISLIRIALNKSNPLVREIVIIKPIRYKTIATIPAEPVERSFIALSFLSLLPFTISPSAKSAKPSAWWIPVTIAIEATTNKLTSKGSKKKDNPKPKEPTKSPIAIPTIGKRYMYFAIFSRFAFDDGKIVRKEKTEPISLSMNPPSNQW